VRIGTGMEKIILMFAFIVSFTIFAETSSRGEIRLESRVFNDDEVDSTRDEGYGIATSLEVKYENQKNVTANFQLFTRIDNKDDSRNTVFLQEANVGYNFGNVEFKLGPQIINWSATEAFHPVDSVNSRNLDSDFESSEKIGETMIQLGYLFEESSLTLYYFPLLEENIFPANSNRLFLFPNGLVLGEALFLKEDGEFYDGNEAEQWGARFDISLGALDLSIHSISHINRSKPVLIAGVSGNVHPTYIPVVQTGGTIQWPLESWVIKVEGAYFDFQDKVSTIYGDVEQLRHGEAAVGLEYGWNHENGWETSVILEANGITGLDKPQRQSLSAFQNDSLLGVRLALNNEDSGELLFTVISDNERSHEQMYNFKYSQRLTDVWSIKMGARLVDAPYEEAVATGIQVFHNDHQYYLNISRFF
jgi:hypothetical protein